MHSGKRHLLGRSGEADAEAEEADAGEQSGYAEDDADVAVRAVKPATEGPIQKSAPTRVKSFEVSADRFRERD